jgi:hypothetical protein
VADRFSSSPQLARRLPSASWRAEAGKRRCGQAARPKPSAYGAGPGSPRASHALVREPLAVRVLFVRSLVVVGDSNLSALIARLPESQRLDHTRWLCPGDPHRVSADSFRRADIAVPEEEPEANLVTGWPKANEHDGSQDTDVPIGTGGEKVRAPTAPSAARHGSRVGGPFSVERGPSRLTANCPLARDRRLRLGGPPNGNRSGSGIRCGERKILTARGGGNRCRRCLPDPQSQRSSPRLRRARRSW